MLEIWESLKDILFSVYGLIGALVFGCCLGAYCLFKFGKILAESRGRKYRRRGKKAEKQAAKLLKKSGFTILEKEPRINTQLRIDGESRSFEITPDFLVSFGEELFIVEVKSHGSSQLINQAGVRRQVVEYVYATGHSCLLVTTQDSRITKVEFN